MRSSERKLVDVLPGLDFVEKYRALTHISKGDDIETPDLAKLTKIVKALDPSATYFKSERFFRLERDVDGRRFWLHIKVSPRVELMLYEMNDAGKYVDGHPLSLYYRRLNKGDMSGLGSLAYSSYAEFTRIVKAGYTLGQEIIDAATRAPTRRKR